MMKSLRYPVRILMAMFSLCMVLAASAFFLDSAVAAGARELRTGTTPIEGVELTLECRACKPPVKVKATTNAEGVVNVVSGLPSLDVVTLQCKRCERMNIGAAGVQFTLTGAGGGEFKRSLSMRELVDGKEFLIEGAFRERKHEYKGTVSIVK